MKIEVRTRKKKEYPCNHRVTVAYNDQRKAELKRLSDKFGVEYLDMTRDLWDGIIAHYQAQENKEEAEAS